MHKLAIIVPYRDRKDHLLRFIPHMKEFLSNQTIQYKIIIIEQESGKPFNRAKLLNIGFDQMKEECDYFCFHDIDLLPVSQESDYSYCKGVCKLSYYVSQFNFIPRPTDELGGVTMFDKETYLDVNGYSNEYWGWGVEDNDLGERCKIKGSHFTLRKGRYISLAHKPNGDTTGGQASNLTRKNRKHFVEMKNGGDIFNSGLDDLEYEILYTKQEQDYKLIKVKI